MKNSYACPLCASEKIDLIESIIVKDLNLLYEKSIGVKNALPIDKLEYMNCKECDLGFFWPMETGSERLYEHLQAFDWYYMNDKQEYKIAERYLPTEGSILEVGSGKASFANIVGKDRYTGLEFNDKAIERANKAGVTLLKESVEDHSIKTIKYDAVVSFQVLEHVKSPYNFIKGCLDCLKPGGILVLAVPSHDGFSKDIINHALDMPPHHVSHWTEKTLTYVSKLFNLKTISVEHEEISSYHVKLAYKTQVETLLRNYLGLKFKLLDTSAIGSLISKMATLFSIVSNQKLKETNGHTAVAVYRKPLVK